ncbi:baseplate J/gp47 family protein [Conexibacter sp. CPCC 206217]|uniref:baseplate J/gp47 family protein n=1 Tax=Conexibacter sp. CPCC 206217 TaxID=3064574 RepID=UPI002725C246|nr:baseplate J/gp47 family protein [Conexibacter sp. CPCC 206217]MDO8209289.1 baseplate J/gp47 family protein [Conexibacter sp. CPCC 206217]
MAVIRPEIETDPAELEQIAISYLQEALPGWEPAPGDLMTWLISAHAQMIAEERDIAADVPIEQIMRPLGEQVHLVAPRLALPASVDATVTVRDQAGYTVPAGLEVLVRTAGDDGVTMVVVRDATLRPSRGLNVQVQLEAAPGREGSAGNGLDSDNEIVSLRALEFIRSIRIDAPNVSSGGRDAETDEEYLERLVDTLALASPTPILPDDFAAIARQVDGVERALAINLVVDRPEIIEIISESFNGYVFAAGEQAHIEWGEDGPATADEVRRSFERVFYTADVTGGGSEFVVILPALEWTPYGPWSFVVTGGGSVDGFTVIQEAEYQVAAERAVTVAVIDEAGERPELAVLTAVQTTLESMREVNWRVSVIGPSYTEISVDFTAVAWPDYDAATVQLAAVAAITDYLEPANWGRGKDGDQADDATWIQEPVVRYLELAQVLNDVPGVHYIDSLRLDGGAGWVQANVPLGGRAPLPRPKDRGITGRVIGS